MSYTSEEYRFLNNLAVMLDLGWDLQTAIESIRNDVTDEDLLVHYDTILARLDNSSALGDTLAESELISDESSRLIIRSGQSSGMLQARLTAVAKLVGARYEGELDPYQRFLETWAVCVESGVSIEASLTALTADYQDQPLGVIAGELLAGKRSGKPLFEVAQDFPDEFSSQARQLLRYGERRNMALALRSIVKLV
jgi:type II secretory pathway component PulF